MMKKSHDYPVEVFQKTEITTDIACLIEWLNKMTDDTVEMDLSEDEEQMLIDVGVNILLACAVAGKTYRDVIEWLLRDTDLGGIFGGENQYMKEQD